MKEAESLRHIYHTDSHSFLIPPSTPDHSHSANRVQCPTLSHYKISPNAQVINTKCTCMRAYQFPGHQTSVTKQHRPTLPGLVTFVRESLGGGGVARSAWQELGTTSFSSRPRTVAGLSNESRRPGFWRGGSGSLDLRFRVFWMGKQNWKGGMVDMTDGCRICSRAG